MEKKIDKILIANRGEIALRIIRSAREMNIKTVAVYSEADRLSPHVFLADESVFIGKAAASESYLKIEKIIDAALKTNSDAIHPGYGFLSENAVFANAVEKAGLIFIGPSAAAIEIMGSKLAAKAAVSKYETPLVPGTDKAIESPEEGINIAAEIGYPILIKASAGGGGKGMRIVDKMDDFEEQMLTAISEAKSAFGDGAVFIEKYIASPKHIEVQVLGDKYGNYVYLHERECSIQRRHQKVIEEAPSPVVDEKIRKKLGEAAINAAKSCKYYNAGTVEFIMDREKNFYFLEMNTRLQVEHPVTEMITGIDLVKEQIKIARGDKLSFEQHEIPLNGHSIELRVYAEDPENNFLPDTGKLTNYQIPAGFGVRVDDGFREGMDIPVYYDPMIAKLIVHGLNREEAISRMIRAIEEYKISGIKNTLQFGKFVLEHPAFKDGSFDTHFVKNYFEPQKLKEKNLKDDKLVAEIALRLFLNLKEEKEKSLKPLNDKASKWREKRIKLRGN
ncbi:MAG: acetyl-CoA carboxylase biotin carboxylase subunit [Chitinophagaceae bacterium]|nr:MAG: acetyl-CoA carboxylase biotin carboxylase subunit [Chitinophagaceae bacterium]